jgi:predicted RNA-binding protein associated with RNAse of E/G family
MDRNIYSVRDKGYDFKTSKKSGRNFKIDIKTITYNGEGEKELKVKIDEYIKKTPDEYVLVFIDKDNLKEATILGYISREDFEKNKKEKKYMYNYSSTYYIGESLLHPIKLLDIK